MRLETGRANGSRAHILQHSYSKLVRVFLNRWKGKVTKLRNVLRLG